MTTMQALRATVTRQLNANGFTKANRHFVLETPDLRWIVELDASRHGAQLRVDLGCSPKRFQADASPIAVNYCPIYLFMEFLPLAVEATPSLEDCPDFRSYASAALDLRVEMPEHERVGAIGRIIAALAEFVRSTTTEAGLCQLVREGVFESGFVNVEIRNALLQSDTVGPVEREQPPAPPST